MSFWVPQVVNVVSTSPLYSVGLPIALGSASGLVTQKSVNTWYPTLRKPPYGDPPRAAFPVAWTSLYAAMGYGSYLLRHTIDTSLSKNDRRLAHQAFGLYWFSLALNLAWTPLFFGLQMPTLALLDITTLTGVVYVITYKAFHIKASKLAGWLFLPYSLWLTYATYLNGGSWYLNILPRWQRKAEDKIHKGKDDL